MKRRNVDPFDAIEQDARETAAHCLRIILGCMIVLITVAAITGILTE